MQLEMLLAFAVLCPIAGYYGAVYARKKYALIIKNGERNKIPSKYKRKYKKLDDEAAIEKFKQDISSGIDGFKFKHPVVFSILGTIVIITIYSIVFAFEPYIIDSMT